VNNIGNGGGGGGPVPASISGTIAVGTAPSAIAVDPTTNKIYVADYGTGQPVTGRCQTTGSDVTVIDGATDSSSTITPPDTTSNALAVVVNSASDATYLIVQKYTWINTIGRNCTTFQAGIVAINGAEPNGAFCAICQFGGVAVNPLTNNIYLAMYSENPFGEVYNTSVGVIATGSSEVFVPLPGKPVALAVDSARNKVYVLTQGSSDITVIDGATSSASTLATSANGANAVAVNPATDQIYVANRGGDNVTVIDGATGTTTTIPVGTSPSGVDVDSRANFIYVANAGNSQTGDPGSVTVINGSTNATTTLVDPKATNPVAVAVSSVTRKVYVANKGSNNVTVIDGAHN
jgi:YVTN family beta-propeller protein